MKTFEEFITEEQPEVSIGDEVLIGKFKNKRAVVNDITTDANNQPVLKTSKGDVSLFKPRIVKLIPPKE